GPEGYTLLAMSQLMEGIYTEAADNAHRVHTLGDQGYSVAHFIAGQALRAQRRVQEAMVEYEWYLRETPQGPNAENARKELAELQPADVIVSHQSYLAAVRGAAQTATIPTEARRALTVEIAEKNRTRGLPVR